MSHARQHAYLKEPLKTRSNADFTPFRERRSYSAEALGAGVKVDKLEVFRGSLMTHGERASCMRDELG
jgi:hypothetical protein